MSSPNSHTPLSASYDQSLLAAAPAATKAARQEGYNVDLLDERRHRSTPPTSMPDLEGARSTKETHSSQVINGPAAIIPSPSKKLPFWRTPWGLFGLVVIAVIIVGAIVGGAVGGTVGKENKGNHGLSRQTQGQQSFGPVFTSLGQQPEQGTQQGIGPVTGSAPVTTPRVSSSSSSGQNGLAFALPTISFGPGQ